MKNEIYELMSMNVGSKKIREYKRILIVGSCVITEYPHIYNVFKQNNVTLHVCMESIHFNMVALKISSILARIPVEEIIILTVDGSPHCVQLHTAVEEAMKITRSKASVRHIVIESGKALEVSNITVKTSRYLSKIDKLLKKI